MFFPQFLFLINCKTYSIEKESISSYFLDNEDLIKINSSNMITFIHITSHFFFGLIKIIYSKDGIINNYIPKPGENLMYKNCLVEIQYLDAKAAAKIDIWHFEYDKCNERTIHSRNQITATISSDNFLIEKDTCYLFDFDSQTTIQKLNNTNNININIFYQSKESFISKNISEISGSLPPLFAIKFHKGNTFNGFVSFSNSKNYGDWSDMQKKFSCYPQSNCNKDDFEDFHLSIDRSVKWWIWTLIFGFVGIGFVLIFGSMLRFKEFSEQSINLSLKI